VIIAAAFFYGSIISDLIYYMEISPPRSAEAAILASSVANMFVGLSIMFAFGCPGTLIPYGELQHLLMLSKLKKIGHFSWRLAIWSGCTGFLLLPTAFSVRAMPSVDLLTTMAYIFGAAAFAASLLCSALLAFVLFPLRTALNFQLILRLAFGKRQPGSAA
jgi:hypothetical protein